MSGSSQLWHAGMVLRLAATVAACLFAGMLQAQAEPEPRPALQVELAAPDVVRELLERHVRVLGRPGVAAPGLPADRIALERRTRREIIGLLATEGYFSPETVLKEESPERWSLTVAPGERARVDEVVLNFEGHIAAEDDALARRRQALRRSWALAAGQVFRQGDWDAAKQLLLHGVSQRDYAAARISASSATVDVEAATVSLSVTIDSGPPFFIGPLAVSGLETLPEDLVARYSMLRPGEPFDQERLLAFQSVLQNAPQFASVIVGIDRDPALAAAVPVRVHASEAQSRHLSFGAGFSTNTGARAETNWRDVNLFDRAWELSTGLRLEQRRQAAYADVFLPPAHKGHRDSFGLVVESSDIEGLKMTRQAFGAERTRQRNGIETAISLRYEHENLRPAGGQASARKALAANWSRTWRKIDDLLDPRSGHVIKVDLGGGTRALLSDQDFFRTRARFARYQPVGERDVLIVRAEVGATVAKSREGIPQDYLFRTGGAQSVRGYGFESLGVQQGEAVVGGRYLGTASAEYVHWFLPQWGVAGFVDAGDAADDRDSLAFKTGYGAGARWRSPAGPIALDLAYGHQARRFRLHFAIAVAF